MYTGPLAAVSNRETWTFLVELTDPATDIAIDLTGAEIEIAVRAQTAGLPTLTGSLADKIALVGAATDGSFRVTFSRDDMATLRAGLYDVGLRVMVSAGTTYQLLVCTLPVVDGVIAA